MIGERKIIVSLLVKKKYGTARNKWQNITRALLFIPFLRNSRFRICEQIKRQQEQHNNEKDNERTRTKKEKKRNNFTQSNLKQKKKCWLKKGKKNQRKPYGLIPIQSIFFLLEKSFPDIRYHPDIFLLIPYSLFVHSSKKNLSPASAQKARFVIHLYIISFTSALPIYLRSAL